MLLFVLVVILMTVKAILSPFKQKFTDDDTEAEALVDAMEDEPVEEDYEVPDEDDVAVEVLVSDAAAVLEVESMDLDGVLSPLTSDVASVACVLLTKVCPLFITSHSFTYTIVSLKSLRRRLGIAQH